MTRTLSIIPLLVALVACADSNTFPTEIRVVDDGQAQRVAEFIDARYTWLERAYGPTFVRYVDLVKSDASIPADLFYDGFAVYLELEGGATENIVYEFLDSPHGAYLSTQDIEFIERTLVQRKSQDSLAMEEASRMLDEPERADLIEKYNLFYTYIGSVPARQALDDISDEHLRIRIRAVREHLVATGRYDVWRAMLEKDGATLQSISDADDSADFQVFTMLSVVTKGVMKSKHSLAVAEIVAEALYQAIWSESYGYVSGRLQNSGFNDFMGAERGRHLRARIVDAMEAVEEAANAQ